MSAAQFQYPVATVVENDNDNSSNRLRNTSRRSGLLTKGIAGTADDPVWAYSNTMQDKAGTVNQVRVWCAIFITGVLCGPGLQCSIPIILKI